MLAVLLIAGKWIGLAGMVFVGVTNLFWHGWLLPETHYIAGTILTMLFALAQVMTIYYFYGMRRALINATSKHELDPAIAARAVELKKIVAGRGYILALLATAAPIAGGGTLFGPLPLWIHYSLAAMTVLLGIQTGIVEYRAFRENASLFDRAAAVILAETPESSS